MTAKIGSEHDPKLQAPRHQPELDGIRGIAILLVLLSHAAGQLGVLPHLQPHPKWTPVVAFLLVPGWGGVDLFFVLSGFLITGILLRGREKREYFTSFYARRVLRIFPIYYLFLCGTLIAGHFWPEFGAKIPQTGREIVSYFLYLQNWPWFWPTSAGMYTIWGAFWSLAVEEQFYLIWPALVRFLTPRTMLTACVAGFLLGAPLRWAVIHHVTGLNVGCLQFPLSRLDGLFLGAACALFRHIYNRAVPLSWAVAAFCAGVAIYGYIAAFHTREIVGTGMHICTFGVTGFALMSVGLVAASQHAIPWLQRALTLRPLILLGKYSYGIYVYHLSVYLGIERLAHYVSPSTAGEFTMIPALGFMLLAIFASTAVAAVSFSLIEQPFLKLKRFFPSPGSAR
jgi:peptidoglycan/LPS O-acetylase OafA/YrhL